MRIVSVISRRRYSILAALIVIVALVVAYRFVRAQGEEAARAREAAAGPHVRVGHVIKGPGEHTTTVIGETRPYESATLYAKVSGYLTKVAVDKGDIVKAGQLLAVIESPETDEAYVAAAADARNKSAIAARTSTLFAKRLVSQQEADQARADAEVATARLHTQATLKSYEILRAPFPGTITARYADPGALVQNATSSESSALPVLMVSQIRKLRVDVFLDQREATFISKEDPVEISLQERPGLKILGQVSRISDALDTRTKMLLTEIDIPNEDRQVMAGSFVQVSLKVKAPPFLLAPVESLVMKDGKSFLTEITPDHHLTYRPVVTADSDGKSVRIVSGAAEGDLLALNVGDSIAEGGVVRPLPEEAKAK